MVLMARNVRSLEPCNVAFNSLSPGDMKLQTVLATGTSEVAGWLVQLSLTRDVTFAHFKFTANEANSGKVQFPLGQENSGLGGGSISSDHRPE